MSSLSLLFPSLIEKFSSPQLLRLFPLMWPRHRYQRAAYTQRRRQHQSWAPEVVWQKKKKKKGKEFVITSSGGFPDSTIGKESTCNARDPSSTPGSVRCTGEGIGYPLQYSWVSLVAQLVKHPPAMQETWVWFLHWENPLEKGKAIHSSILAWIIPWTV